MKFKIIFFIIFYFFFLNQIYANNCKNEIIDPHFTEDFQFIKNPRVLKFMSLSVNPEIQLSSIRQIRKLMFNQSVYDKFINAGIIPVLVRHLKSNNTAVIHEATWALTNLASGTSEQTQSVVEADSIPALMDLLEYDNLEVVNQAVWALANIIGDNSINRDYCIKLGIIPKLVKLIDSNNSTAFYRNVAWTMVNICRHTSQPISFQSVQELLAGFQKLLNHHDVTVISDSLWGIVYITEAYDYDDDFENYIRIVLNQKIIVKRIFELLTHPKQKIRQPTIQILKFLVSGTDDQTQEIMDYGILMQIKKMLKLCNTKEMRIDIIQISSYIMSGPIEQVQAVFDVDLISNILDFTYSEDKNIINGAIHCIRNAVRHSEAAEAMIKMGVIQDLCEVLKDFHKSDSEDDEAIEVMVNALTALEEIGSPSFKRRKNVLKEMQQLGAFSVIQKLQNHQNDEIRDMAKKYKLNISKSNKK